jgi:hypothetical protein
MNVIKNSSVALTIGLLDWPRAHAGVQLPRSSLHCRDGDLSHQLIVVF